jgi:hypothetical protein
MNSGHLSVFSLWLSNKSAGKWRIPDEDIFEHRNPDVPRRSFVLKALYLNSI